MRLFVAIDLSDSVRQRISGMQGKLGLGDFDLKLVEPENLHMTLKFLGEVDESGLGQIEKSVSDAVKGFRPFRMVFEGVGYFGSERHMKVIWAGVKDGKEEFSRIAESLDRGLSYVRKDGHKNSPHLTIARVKSGRNKEALMREVDSLGGVKIGEVGVKDVRLKQSVLTPQGPVYSDVKVFHLGKECGPDG